MVYRDLEKQRANGRKQSRIWKQRHPEKKREAVRRYYARTAFAPRSREPWTVSEIRRIMDENKPTDQVLADQMSRSVRAIQAARERERKRRANLAGSALY